MNDKCIILTYFGKVPNYFNLFLKSCIANDDYDFLIFGDCFKDFENRANVNFHYMNINQFKNKASDALGFEAVIESPYKVCDYRPMFGLIYQEYIENYKFWAFCDCDLIFGKISHFLTSELFDSFDKILTRGHLSFFRNNGEMNNLFRHSYSDDKCPDYKKVFSSNKNFSFDEWNGIKRILVATDTKYYDNTIFDDVLSNKFYFYPTDMKYNHIAFQKNIFYKYENGKIYRCSAKKDCVKIEKEVLYVHLQKRNMDKCVDDLDEFYIIPNSFVNSSITNIKDFRQNIKIKTKIAFSHKRIKIRFKNLGKRIKSIFNSED